MAEQLATTDQLAERLSFVMDPDEIREAQGALVDLSDEARHYGSDRWLDPATTPQSVINLVLRAAARHMKNYDGFTQSRAGDESVSWSDKGVESGSAHFTEGEQTRLSELGGYRRTGFHTVGMWGYTRKAVSPNVGLVPDNASNEPVQMFTTNEPW
jgi:hypothetical protein